MMIHAKLVPALVSAALHLAPARVHNDQPWGSESEADVRLRYESIAADIVAVAYDPEERPVRGLSRRHTASLLLAMAIGESRLASDVDTGACYRLIDPLTGYDYKARCDFGKAHTIWQLQPDALKVDADALVDRKVAAREALRALRGSVSLCWHMPPRYRLSAYGQGYCGPLDGAAERWKLAGRTMALVDGALTAAERE